MAPDGTITRLGDQIGDVMPHLAACSLDRGFFAITGRDGSGDLAVSVWRILADGSLQHRASTQAGTVRAVSVAYTNPLRLVKEELDAFQFVLPVRDASDKLRTIVWRYADGKITRQKTAVDTPITEVVAATSPDLDCTLTASRRSDGTLALQGWRVGEHDGTITLAGQANAPAGGKISMADIGSDSVAASTSPYGRSLIPI